MTPPNHEAHFALYANAHHDLWWARTQQWSVANWALILIAGIGGVGKALADPCHPLEHVWVFVALVVIVALVAGGYFRTLHGEIVHNREVYRALETETGIDTLRTNLPGQDRGVVDTDWRRGIGPLFFIVLLAMGVATVFSIRLLGLDWARAILLGAGVVVVDVIVVLEGALRWKSRQQVCTCDHKRLMDRDRAECFAKPCPCLGFVAPLKARTTTNELTTFLLAVFRPC
jgi:hypothetical protein